MSRTFRRTAGDYRRVADYFSVGNRLAQKTRCSQARGFILSGRDGGPTLRVADEIDWVLSDVQDLLNGPSGCRWITAFWDWLLPQFVFTAGFVVGEALARALYWLMCSSSLRWLYQVNFRMMEVMATTAKVMAAVCSRHVTM